MATIDSRTVIDRIIRKHGREYADGPDVVKIVEYTTPEGKRTWGVVWANESPQMQDRYEEETEYVRSPRVIWRRDAPTNPS